MHLNSIIYFITKRYSKGEHDYNFYNYLYLHIPSHSIPGVSRRYVYGIDVPKCDIRPEQRIVFPLKTFKVGIWQSIGSPLILQFL